MTGHNGIELTDELIERMVLERSSSRAASDLVDGIMAGVAATPQRQASLLPALPRIGGSRSARLMFGAVLALLVLAAAVVVGSRLLQHRTPLDPAALLGSWIPLVPPGPDESKLEIVIGPPTIGISHDLPTNGFEINATFQGRVYNSWSFLEPDRLELVMDLTMQPWNCRMGDAGSYRFLVSSDGRTMALTPVADACGARAAILGGDWIRTDVTDASKGRHTAFMFRPFGDGATPQFSYDVPDDGAEVYETPDALTLPLAGSTVSVYSNPTLGAEPATCTVTPGDSRQTPAATVARLATVPGLVVTEPTTLTIGGLDGVMVDVSVDPEWTSACLADAYVSTFAEPNLLLARNAAARYILLDRGDGGSLLIAIEMQDKATRDAVIAATMPIIRSFEFTR